MSSTRTLVSRPATGPGRRDRLLGRAVLTASAFVAAAAVVTGAFIAKVAHAGATPSSGTGVVDNPANGGGGLPGLSGLLPDSNHQAPVGGSNGS